MIPLLDKTIVKISLVLALVGALIAFSMWIHAQVFNAGRNDAIAEIAKANEKKDKELSDRLSAAIIEKDEQKKKASKLQSDLRKSQAEERRLRNEIDNANFNCVSIGDSFVELWNEIIESEK